MRAAPGCVPRQRQPTRFLGQRARFWRFSNAQGNRRGLSAPCSQGNCASSAAMALAVVSWGAAGKDRLRLRPADARRCAETDAPGAGLLFPPETPPDTSRAEPPGSPGAGSRSPSIPPCPYLCFVSVAVNHGPMNALCHPTSKSRPQARAESFFRTAQPGKLGIQHGDGFGRGWAGRRRWRDGRRWRRRQSTAGAQVAPVSYGDAYPVHRIARSLTTAEALIGQMYPAILIATLVGMALQARFEAAVKEGETKKPS